MLEVSYLGVPIKVYSFTGTVVDSNKQRETKVTGGGGGGSVYQGTGAVAPIHIQSSTTVHDQFFLIDDTGKEISVRLQNWDITLRTEHRVQVIWAITGKASEGPFVAVHNHNLNNVNWNDAQLKTVVSPCLLKHLLIGLIASIAVGYVLSSFSLSFIGIVATLIYFFVRRSMFANDLKQKIQNHFI